MVEILKEITNYLFQLFLLKIPDPLHSSHLFEKILCQIIISWDQSLSTAKADKVSILAQYVLLVEFWFPRVKNKY